MLLASSADWQSAESLRSSLPDKGRTVAYWRGEDAAFLAVHVADKGVSCVVRLESGKTEIVYSGEIRTQAKTRRISSLDLDGVIAGPNAVLFYTEPRLASSAISFDTGKDDSEKMAFIVTGMGPGMWEIWRDGWVVDIGVPVRAGEAVLAFKGRPGSYFIRRLQ